MAVELGQVTQKYPFSGPPEQPQLGAVLVPVPEVVPRTVDAVAVAPRRAEVPLPAGRC